ncbi:hypothetical protein LBMAG53_20930 [Planctomycetota bacterium]|nr:hypothetical protein LBMAG53_20930 [Planctomycetota bacterium]
MSDFFAETFFDEPGLLGVHLRRSERSPVHQFAARAPDVGSGFDPDWWTKLAGGLGLAAVGLTFASITVSQLPSCSDQTANRPTITSPVQQTSDGASTWIASLGSLADDLQPARKDLWPFAIRTLFDVPRELGRRGDATGGWLKPRCAREDVKAYEDAMRLRLALPEAGPCTDLAIILDLPGPQAVAAAAALADLFDPVFLFDNLPHPAAVVPVDETLAAAIYWRPSLLTTKPRRATDAPPVFVLEGLRLTVYANQVDRFDNRSVARLPTAQQLRTLGVRRVLYIRPSAGSVAEQDDLNDLFVAYNDDGLPVRHLGLDAVPQVNAVASSRIVGGGSSSAATSSSSHTAWFLGRYHWKAGPPDEADQDARYRAQRRAVAVPVSLDGGKSHQGEALARLESPSRSSPSNSGGTRSRSNSWHFS